MINVYFLFILHIYPQKLRVLLPCLHILILGPRLTELSGTLSVSVAEETIFWGDAHWLSLEMTHILFYVTHCPVLVTRPPPTSEPKRCNPAVCPEGGAEEGEGLFGKQHSSLPQFWIWTLGSYSSSTSG